MANQHSADNIWTDAKTAELTRLVATGRLTARAIADRLGGGITRNAVIGKCRRLALQLKIPQGHQWRDADNTAPRPKPRKAPQSPKERRQRVPPTIPCPDQGPPSETAPMTAEIGSGCPSPDPVSEPVSEPVDIFSLKFHHCRWPMWGFNVAPTVYCGRHREEPHVYCSQHAKVAYRAPNPKRI